MTTKREFHGTFTAKICEFSREEIHIVGEPSDLTDCDIDDEFINVSFVPEFYANGFSKDAEGYLSLVFDYPSECILTKVRYFETVFFIAAIDIDGNKRFLQSMSLSRNILLQGINFPKFGFYRYIARKDLLRKADELLPEDTLTLCVDIYLLTHAVPGEDYSDAFIESTVMFSFKFVNFAYHLLLDSVVGRRLSETSSYFRLMLAAPMRENRTKQMKVAYEEYPVFKNIARIMMEAKYIEAHNMRDVCMLYIVADRYSITTIIEICRRLFQNHICNENIGLIRELSQMYKDRSLEEIMQSFQNDLHYENRQNRVNSEWNRESGRMEIQYTTVLPEVNEPSHQFDFYS